MKKIFIILITLIFNLIYSHSFNSNNNIYEFLDRQTLGDINEDGVINIQDVILLINLILNNEYDALADLNSDSISNVLDVVQIVNIILYGVDNEECIEEYYSTVDILTDINQQIYNNDESVNAYSIYSWSSNESDRILSGNGIPNHEVGTFPNSSCPNTISEQNVNENFTLFPEIISDEGNYGVGGPNNTSAYALNSVKFDPATAGRCNNQGVCSLAQGQGQWNIEAL